MPVWRYLERGGKRASLWWHRRGGKDEVCLHWTALQAIQRIGNYWHMLPEASQARRAIWHAVNPHTGRRRIDDIFPLEIRKRTLDQEMLIELINGSTWQVIGSDNFRSLVGAPPIGIVFSEWSKANPQALAYLSPILAENDGFALFPTTPMGKNHAYETHESFRRDPDCFAETLTAEDTGVFSDDQLRKERQTYVDIYGDTLGNALFEQEYYCNPDVAVIGAVYAKELADARTTGRIGLDFDPANSPVYTSWDIGRTDATAIWFWQLAGGEIRILDYYEAQLKDVDHYVSQITGREVLNPMAEWAYGSHQIRWGQDIDGLEHRRKYDYGMHYVPHDAAHRPLVGGGQSIEQMLRKALGRVQVIDNKHVGFIGQVALTRAMLQRAFFHRRCDTAIDMLGMYRYSYDEKRRKLSTDPVHDWTSHGADALRIGSVAISQLMPRLESVQRVDTARRPIRYKRSRGTAWSR
jgi:hypothetical protein